MASADPYFDEKLGELRNLLEVKSASEFREREPQIVFANELEIDDLDIQRSNDLDELLLIHKQLFRNVYDWAGTTRTIDIRKNTEGSDFFLPFTQIPMAARYVFEELRREHYLQGLDKDSFVARLSYFYDQLNYIHPFREGNGRAQRVFWSRVARSAGYDIDWAGVVGDENDEASREAAETMNRFKLETMFGRIIERP